MKRTIIAAVDSTDLHCTHVVRVQRPAGWATVVEVRRVAERIYRVSCVALTTGAFEAFGCIGSRPAWVVDDPDPAERSRAFAARTALFRRRLLAYERSITGGATSQ